MKRKFLSVFVALALTLGVTTAVTNADPKPAEAYTNAYAWTVTPQTPTRLWGNPLGITMFETGYGTNSYIWKTCLLKWDWVNSQYTDDGCDSDTWDWDYRGTYGCWWDSYRQYWYQMYVTQTWLNIIHSPYYTETVVLYSEPAAVQC